MKVRTTSQPRATLEEFADRHNLVMEVKERPLDCQHHGKYTASFERAETTTPGSRILTGAYGDGETPEDAMRDYGQEISGKILVVNAWGDGRRELDVPIIVEGGE